MTNRMTAAILALLLGAGASLAQPTPPPLPPQAPLFPDTSTGPAIPAAPQAPDPVFPTATTSGPTGQAFWAEGDMLFSWLRGVSLPPLVTTSTPGTPAALAGVLGQPTTRTLFGGSGADDGIRYGFRLAGGYWFGASRIFGVEAGFLMLGSQSTSFSTTSASSPILARPYTDATNFSQQAALLSYPGLANDSIGIGASSGHLYSANVDLDAKLVNEGWFRLIGMAGWRYIRYDEGLNIDQTILPTSAAFVPGTKVGVTDAFSTRNLFQGVDLGVKPQFVWQAWTFDFLARASIGNLHSTVDIAGQQTVAVPGFAVVTTPGGLYALSTNIGHHTNNDWVVIPEFGAGVGWQITPNLKLRLGYGLLFLNGVARAADQVNTTINPLHLPGSLAAATGPTQPAFYLTRTDIWVQNVNLGLQFTY